MIKLFLVKTEEDFERKINSVSCQGPNGSENTVFSGSNTPHGVPRHPLEMLAAALNAIENFVVAEHSKETGFRIEGTPIKLREIKAGLKAKTTEYLVMTREEELEPESPGSQKGRKGFSR